MLAHAVDGANAARSNHITVKSMAKLIARLQTAALPLTCHVTIHTQARYITLLEEVLASDHRMFVHAVIEQQDSADDVQESAQFPGAYVGSNFVLQAATLVRVGAAEATCTRFTGTLNTQQNSQHVPCWHAMAESFTAASA